MNRKFLIAGAGALAVAAAVLLSGQVLGLNDDKDTGNPNPAVVSPSTPEKITLKAYDGKLAVFLGSTDGTPAAETGISVDSLRAYDQALVEKGITVGSYEELLKLLEDFGP